MRISCLHTAEAHVATFDALLTAQNCRVDHVVRDDLLTRAQANGVDTIAAEVTALLSELAAADAVLCTCSTLGVIVDQVGIDHVLRIDRPALTAAISYGPKVLLAICLESTRDASVSLLQDCAAGQPMTPSVVVCADAWDFFLTGDMDGYANKIAHHVKAACTADNFDAVVLAQASMQVAAAKLNMLKVPVLTTPAMAAQATLAVASARI